MMGLPLRGRPLRRVCSAAAVPAERCLAAQGLGSAPRFPAHDINLGKVDDGRPSFSMDKEAPSG